MNAQDPLTTTYYHHNGVTITDRWFAAEGHRYDIVHLKNIVQTKGSLHIGAMVALVIAAAEAVIFVPVVGFVGAPIGVLAGIFALMIPCAVAVVCVQRWPSRHELWAEYGGVEHTLFSSQSEREFGQVARALMRAIEAAVPEPLPEEY